jgi:hypothetical protein
MRLKLSICFLFIQCFDYIEKINTEYLQDKVILLSSDELFQSIKNSLNILVDFY